MRYALVAAIMFGFGAGACTEPPAAPAAGEMTEMTAAPEAVGPIIGEGTVTAVSADSVTINHGPIAAIDWPAMTMQFRADDPAVLAGIAVGDQVSFQLESASETGTVISVVKR